MFTLEQINDIHDKYANSDTLVQYLSALKAIGVRTYDSYITDEHSEYVGEDGQKVVSPPIHKKLSIAATRNRENFMRYLRLHEQGKTSYEEMSQGLAESGVEKWTFDTNKMTLTYFDKAGELFLVEDIK
jgi:uncharacterized protein YbcV (DUF1398 family)